MPFVESFVSGFEDGPAAAIKQCWILNPNLFALLSRSTNLEPALGAGAQRVKPELQARIRDISIHNKIIFSS